MKMLELVALKRNFGGIKAVDSVSLSIEEGSVVGLIGPNGSGKTTLFNVIAGILKPDSGEIRFRGEKIDRLSPSERFQKGLVKSFQIPSLFQNMTVLENLMVPPKKQIGEKGWNAPFHKRWETQEVQFAKHAKDTIDFLQLHKVHQNPSRNLSGGQMKLCEIGRAIMGEPTLMLLDEPTAGVAPHLAHEILGRIIKLRERGKMTFFIIEHRLEIFLDYVDYVFAMHLGKVIAEGKPREVVENSLLQEVYLGG